MTDTTDTANEPADQTEDQQLVGAEVADTSAEQQGGNREAAKYRRQLRETETERDTLRERVASYERAEAERIAADRLADPADLWTGGVDLEALRDGGGAIDAAKVRAAIDSVLESHPHWQKTTRGRTPVGSLKSGASGDGFGRPGGWAQAFADATRET